MKTRWRVLVDPPAAGAVNMARDHALAEACAPGTGTLRFYRWDPPTLSFGRNEPVTVGYREILRGRRELGVVRRPTGGRAVIHDRELTYSIVFPARALGGLREAYAKINEGLVHGLRLLGVDARSAEGGDETPAPNAGPCFLGPVDGEVVVAGRKLVGSAQARVGSAVLQHGSLLLTADQSLLLALGGGERGERGQRGERGEHRERGEWRERRERNERRERPVTLVELLDVLPSWEEMVGALRDGFERSLGGVWEAGVLSDAEAVLAEGLERRYRSREWTWRR